MAPAQPRVVFALGDARVAADPAANFLPELMAEAEAIFDLQPDSYSFSDGIGKVETAIALQRAIAMADEKPLVLEVQELPVWKKLREMEAQIQKLTTSSSTPAVAVSQQQQQQPAISASQLLASHVFQENFMAMESRVLKKVDAAVSDLRSDMEAAEATLNNSVAPFLQKLAIDQIDLREKLDAMDSEAGMSGPRGDLLEGLQSQIEELVEEIQSLREQSDSQVEEHEALAAGTSGLRGDLKNVRDVSQLLQQAFKSLHNDILRNENQVESLQGDCKEVMQTVSKMNVNEPRSVQRQPSPQTSAMLEDLAGDAHAQYQRPVASPSPSSSGDLPVSDFAYSMKAPFAGAKKGNLGMSEAATSLFARRGGLGGHHQVEQHRSKLLERGGSGAISLPQLRPIA